MTALSLACYFREDDEFINALLEMKADPKVPEKLPPIFWALIGQKLDVRCSTIWFYDA